MQGIDVGVQMLYRICILYAFLFFYGMFIVYAFHFDEAWDQAGACHQAGRSVFRSASGWASLGFVCDLISDFRYPNALDNALEVGIHRCTKSIVVILLNYV